MKYNRSNLDNLNRQYNIGKRLLEYNVKSYEIAQKLSIDEVIVEAWKNNTRIPTWEQSLKLSKILDISIDFLYYKELQTTHFTYVKENHKVSIYKVFYDFIRKELPIKMKIITVQEEIKLGLKIKYQRNKYGLTQKELGELLDTNKSMINNWETNASTPSMQDILFMSSLFNVSINYFSSNVRELDELILNDLSEDQKQAIFQLINCYTKM